ncbi:MAG: formate dehydrogenase accessory sulfurtransferase FdhD [Candidatus Eremiobacteraeota bacterium]|nr:formate dehydrogenase accessory sulfurtransferase FdhD [Candidatus Eremiobacteraeota bacterium]
MIPSPRAGLTAHVRVVRYDDGDVRETADDVATEEPLEIRVRAAGQTRTAAVTMRTPGNDFELAAGFLFAEGIVDKREDLRGMSYCIDPAIDPEQRYNIVNVDLSAAALPAMEQLERHFTMNSACGVCGKASIESLQTRAQPLPLTRASGTVLRVSMATIAELAGAMRESQRVFSTTGGLHAAALFDEGGRQLVLREDIGRHNALDKVIGWTLLEGRPAAAPSIAFVSGRASFELVQKCIVAAIPVLCAVSAPSSLAVELAKEYGITLCGFVRGSRANVYTHPERITSGHAL